jgi:hypothetical protein
VHDADASSEPGCSRDQHDHTDRDRYGARQRRQLHLDRRQRGRPTHRRVSPVLPTAWR